jgi:hypothetical protein
MDVFCINTNNPEFQKLLAESGEKQGVFAMAISKWMTESGIHNRYPTLQELSITTVESVKPGVEELFDSNPELANQVYETLGFIKAKKTEFTTNEAQSIVNQWKTNAVNLRGEKPSGSQLNELDNAANALFKKLLSLKGEKYTKAPTKATLINNLFDKTKNKQVDLSEESPVSNLLNLATRFFNGGLYDDDITPQQKQQALQVYSQYLDTIFPDSKVKDIVYRGDSTEDYSKEKTGVFGKGIYFSQLKALAKFHADKIKGKINAAILNFKNPNTEYYYHADFKEKAGYKSIYEGIKIKSSEDSLVGLRAETSGEIKEYVAFEPEQIHILGSKQDIEGFKEFVSKPATNKGILNAQKSDEDIIEELVQENKLERKCQ